LEIEIMSRQDKRVKYETQEHGQMDFFQNDVSVMHRHSMSDANEMDLFRTFAESMNNNSDYTSPNMFNDGGHQQNYPRECKAVNTPIYVEPQRSHVQIQVHPMIIQNLPLGHYLTDPFQMVGHFDGNNKTIKPEPSHQHSGMNDMEKMHWNFSENDDNGCFNSVQDADEEHQHSGGGRGGGDKPTKVAKDRRRERNKVLARKTRVKKKAELEILREKMLSLVCESKRLKSVITAYLPEPLALRVFQQSDSHLPENILSIVQQVITRQEKSLFEDLKMQQRSFCIMNATVPDMPIIYASVDFYKLTGYPTEEVIGKNCRILQGPETNRTETARIRRALESGRDIIAVLLNYKKDGTKFWNQIQMAHMKDINEAPSLILGIQSQVSPAMSPPLSGRASSGQIDRGTANAIDALLQQRTRDSQQAAAQQGHTKEKTSNAITNGNSSSSSGGNTTSELITNNTASHSTSSYASVNGTLAKGGVKGNVRKSRSKEAAASTFTDSLAATHSTLSVDPPTTESTAASAFQTACLPSSLSPPCSSLNSSSSRWGVSGVRSNVVLLLKEQNTQPGLGSALLAKAPPSLTRFLKEEQAEKVS
jgi:PAS domain S-box-containing protein